MLAGLAFGSEIKRFGRSRMTRAAIVVLMLLPLVYGALYLWAFWNPFGNVNKMPVALVNTDQGTTVKGKKLDAGAQVSEALKSDKSLDWHVVSPSDARQGVSDGKYYFMLELPPDFSSAIASPLTGTPKKAQLVAVYNDANNYISSTIGQTAMSQVLNAVSTRISGQAVDQVLSMVVDAGGGITQAADGARRLATGAGQLDSGIGTAQNGIGQLADGIGTARSGSAQLASGARRLSDGIDQATDPLLAVTNAISLLGGNTQQLQQGAAALTTAADQMGAFATAQDSAATVLSAAVKQLAASPDPNARATASTLRQLQSQLGAHSFTPAMKQQITAAQNGAIALTSALRTPGSPLQNALDKAGSTGSELTSKINQLRDGAHQLATGNEQLASGMVRLGGGAQQLQSGAVALKSGSSQLAAGSVKLADGLADGAKQVPNWNQQQRKSIADTVGAPVSLNASHENAAGNFGTGMAPFFLTLALFFGAMVLWMILRPLQNRPIAAEVLAIRVVLASYLPAAAIAVVQAVILYGVVRFGLGLPAKHPIAMLGFMVLVSIVFLAATQAINAVVGPAVGRVLIMALLMLQLVSSGGMYPVETTAKPFQILHNFDPMTFGVNGLRQLILGGIDHRLWQAITVLVGIGAVSLLVSSLAARRNRTWNLVRLMPAIKI
ncbi:YhgE/Pip domain-containing protein [Tsukamurella sp. 8F]|uniref:YhgE/Pip domain-containing protein n=1 Tax=unclassified Tsukamurella TaxID=2633480 RepID=UPI0023B88C10|nr:MULTISPECIES: YhgE/Pip domain-containing protein [unclassified Tsukamurella]MDF0529870.1 YhgE/Pip domain-containing protein [Tsukamurella sp. 8J]MDF0588675.1 YhgE/Pip domain-containing protein [Tsukamurella sp. 8F]